MSEPIQISDERFEEEVLRSTSPVVVDFWAPWCAPCRMVAPVIESLSKELAGKVRFVKVNVDENGAQAARYGVQGIPTLLFFRTGEMVDRAVGAYPEKILKEKIEEVFDLAEAN